MTLLDAILGSDAAPPFGTSHVDDIVALSPANSCLARSGRADPKAPPELPQLSPSDPSDQGQIKFALLNVNEASRAREARDRYEATSPPMRSYADFDEYWRVITAIGLTGETSVFCRENLRLFLEPMGRPTRSEVVGVIPMPRSVASECVRLMRIEGGYARRLASRSLFDPRSFGRDELRAALPAAMANLPETWLCLEYGDDFDPIPGALILRLTLIRSKRLRIAAILEVLLLSAEGSRAGLDVPTAGFERWDDAFDEAGRSPDRADHWLEVAQRYCITRDLQVAHAIGPRISAFERWGAAEFRRANYEREHSHLAAALAAARLPALPSGKAAKQFLRAFRKVRDLYGITCTKHRKVDADQLSNNFAARLAVAQLRARQGVCLWREAEAGAAALRQSPGLDRLVFSWTQDVLSSEGTRRRQLQTIRMEAVYRDVLEAELAAAVVQPRFRFVEDEAGSEIFGKMHKPGLESDVADSATDVAERPASEHYDPAIRAIVFRFIEVVSNNGAACVPPWWVDLFASGVLVGPFRLRIDLREVRRNAMIRLKLSARDRGPAGLVGPDGPAEARLHQRALNAGIVLVAAESFGHAMAIGAVGMRTLAVTFARVGELLQMVRREGKDAWQHVDVEGRGRRPGWMALAKGARTQSCFVIYDDRTLPLITTLTKMRLMRERSREVAIVAPCSALARKVKSDRYIFAFREHMLGPDDLNYIYQVLMAGIQRIRNHDMRHAAANRSSRDGQATDAEVAFRLKHAGAAKALPTREPGPFALARTYGRDTALQRDLDSKAYCDARLTFERLLGVPLSGNFL